MLLIKLSLALLPLAFCCVSSSYAPGEVFEIKLSGVEFIEFIYEPTIDGYRESYTKSDGTRHNEQGQFYGGGKPNYYERNTRPTRKPGVKNHKLSPKSLQSLAG